MTGYRDTCGLGAHRVNLDGVALEFGSDGILWSPTPAQEAVMTRDGLRIARFERVESLPTAPPPSEAPALVGAAFETAAIEAAAAGEDAPAAEEAEADLAGQSRGRRRRRAATPDPTAADEEDE